MKKATPILLWVLAFILTLSIAVYQRLTGPSHPVKARETVLDQHISYKFKRSFVEFKSLPVTITATDKAVSAYLSYKRYKTADKWTECEMTRIGDDLTAFVPGEPAAGKVEYSVRIHVDGKNKILNDGVGIVARFTGEVPAIHLAIHIVFMFLSILLTFRVAMETLRKEGNYYWMVNWTLLSTVIGGLIFGPIVQKYAFGDLWTGFPFGTDLTDNKTLIVVIFWVAAFFLKKKSKWWVLLAATLMLIVYLIPHSVMGSELNYNTGKMNNKYGFETGSSKFEIGEVEPYGQLVNVSGGAVPAPSGSQGLMPVS